MAPLQRFEKLSEEKQSRILAVAAQEFAQNGFHGASLNRIIAAAGVSKGAMYYYFEDKADLFVTVCRSFDALVMGDLDLQPDHLSAETFWPTWSELVRRALEVAMSNPAYVGLGKAFHELSPQEWTDGPIGRYIGQWLGELEAIVRRGQALDVVRVDLPASLLVELWMANATILERWTLARWDETPEGAREPLTLLSLDQMKRLLFATRTPPKNRHGALRSCTHCS